jgi:peptidoglycan/xylan/chitin deacetylase (PgdA/CDA1 family)
MSRVSLLIEERSAGWLDGGITPLLTPEEWRTYAALVNAGLPVEMESAQAFRGTTRSQYGEEITLLVNPSDGVAGKIEAEMSREGGCLVILRSRKRAKLNLLPRAHEFTWLAPHRRFRVSARSPYDSSSRLRRILGGQSSGLLQPQQVDGLDARWQGAGEAAIIHRVRGNLVRWEVGVELDRLEQQELLELLHRLHPGQSTGSAGIPPVPSGKKAVVLLLHDVEECLPEDTRGTETVREGIKGCLDSQARHGLRATYNLVGTFAQEIPDLVERIVEDGHEVASHGGSHRVISELSHSHVRDEIEGAEERIASVRKVRVRGFRSPRSRWSTSLLDLLAQKQYLWNAEADPAPYPYRVPRSHSSRLVRIPVAVDDWDYVRHGASPSKVTKLWKGEVERALRLKSWVAIGSHPSVLGVHLERMSAFDQFLKWLRSQDVAVMTLGEGARWWLARGNHLPESLEDAMGPAVRS